MIHYSFGNVWGNKNISAYDGGIAVYTEGVTLDEDWWIFVDDGVVRTDEYNRYFCFRVWTIVVSYVGGDCSSTGGGSRRHWCW